MFSALVRRPHADGLEEFPDFQIEMFFGHYSVLSLLAVKMREPVAN
jgi:hypothetical protein